MTSPQRIRNGLNLNSVMLVISISGCFITAVFYIAPLKSLPDDMKATRGDISEMQRTQAVQTEAIKTLAEVARDGRDLRRDFDRTSADHSSTLKRHDAELDQIRKDIDRLPSH